MKEKIKKHWVSIILILVIIILLGIGLFWQKKQKETKEILSNQIQLLQDYLQEYTINGKSPFFEFRELKNGIFIPTGITIKYIKESSVKELEDNKFGLVLKFDEKGEKYFAELTKRNIGNQIAIYIENVLISAPKVELEQKEGEVIISGLNFLTRGEIENLNERFLEEINRAGEK